jgi:hypothetical protein
MSLSFMSLKGQRFAPIRGTVPKISPVAGLVTGIVPRFNASTHSPLT